jgi:hypothetical protein
MSTPKKSKPKPNRRGGAPKGNKNAAGNRGGGTEPKYDPKKHPERARYLCEKFGFTDRDLAIGLGIALSTLHEWKGKYVEFAESLRVGKDVADQVIKRALYQRAAGYTFPAVKVMQYEGESFEHEYIEHVPPDVGAAKFWLTNRMPKEFKDVSKINHDVDPESPLAALAKQLEGTALRAKED